MALRSVPINAFAAPRPEVLQAQAALSLAVKGRISSSELDRLSYSRDMWPLGTMWVRQGRAPPPPDLIVWPGTEEELVEVLRVARTQRLAVIPFGAGSGVCGGTWALQGGVTVDLKRFDRIGPVDVARREVEVGAGVMGETLERRLNATGWTVGHFPSSIAMSTVGGWLAARGAGQLSSKYGKIEDMVVSLRAVLGTGERLVTPRRPFVGPDLVPLLIGSEGTLCTFTSATLRVFPLAEARVFHGFGFGSVQQGLEAIRRMFREGLRPAVVRLYDPFDTAFAGNPRASHGRKTPPAFKSPFEQDVMPVVLRALSRQTLGRPALMSQLQRLFRKSRLVLMFEGPLVRAEAEDRAATAICRELGADDQGEAPGRAWFAKRYDVAFGLSKLIDSGTFADTMEVAAPWENVLDVYQRVHAAASQFAFVLCHFSHAYTDGCSLYFSFVGSGPNEAAMEERYHAMWRAAMGAAVSAGANVSHHHGIGVLKARALQDSLGEARHAFAALKTAFDPDGIMNPGKLGL